MKYQWNKMAKLEDDGMKRERICHQGRVDINLNVCHTWSKMLYKSEALTIKQHEQASVDVSRHIHVV